MSAATCGRARARLDRAFVEPRAGDLAAIREHLSGCAGCRRYHERLFAADGALAPGARLSPSEEALLLQAALPPDDEATEADRERALLRLRRWLVPAAAALVLLGALWLGARPGEPGLAREPGALAHRGATGDRDAALAPLGLRALCLEHRGLEHRGDGERLRARSLGVRPAAGDAPCPRGAALGFSVRNETGRAWHLQIVAIDSAGATVGVLPTSRDDGAGVVEPADDERPLAGGPLSLAARAPGLLRLVARFTAEPPGAGDLLEAVLAGRAARLTDGRTLELAIEVGR